MGKILWFSIVSAFCLCTCTYAALLKECPHPEDTYPCYCEEDEDLTTLHCNYLHQSKQLIDGLSRLTEHKFTSVSVWMFDTGILQSDAFKGPAIDEIVFSHSSLIVQNPPFVGQENSLSRITFISCFDEEDLVNTWSLGHLNKLKEVSFEKNDIPVLKNNWLTSAGPNLRAVTFDSCKIATLEDKVFAKLTALTTLYLLDNKIKTVSRSMFPRPAENLRSLVLNDNQIDTLPDDIFEDMPSLKTVQMERNKLKTFSESVWGSVVESFSRLYLEGNPIRCDRDLKWLTKRNLPSTFTGECSEPEKMKGKRLRILLPADFH